MKSGRLLKFVRPGALVHAYLYREGDEYRAAVYVTLAGRAADTPSHTLRGPSEAAVEQEARAWVDAHFPKPR
jgi:hypothetical protein